MTARKTLALGAACALPLALAACDLGEFDLQLLHFADVDGQPEALSNVDNFSAWVRHYREQAPERTLLVSSGDNLIPGPRYFAAADDALADLLGIAGAGRGDIAFLNAMGVAASAVGNHDLDQGTEAFAALIAPETDPATGAEWPGAAFPYLAANLDFTPDAALDPLVTGDGREAGRIPGRLAGSARAIWVRAVTAGGRRSSCTRWWPWTAMRTRCWVRCTRRSGRARPAARPAPGTRARRNRRSRSAG